MAELLTTANGDKPGKIRPTEGPESLILKTRSVPYGARVEPAQARQDSALL